MESFGEWAIGSPTDSASSVLPVPTSSGHDDQWGALSRPDNAARRQSTPPRAWHVTPVAHPHSVSEAFWSPFGPLIHRRGHTARPTVHDQATRDASGGTRGRPTEIRHKTQ